MYGTVFHCVCNVSVKIYQTIDDTTLRMLLIDEGQHQVPLVVFTISQAKHTTLLNAM